MIVRRIVPTSPESHDLRMQDLDVVLSDGRVTRAEVDSRISPHADSLCRNNDSFDSEYREELVKLAYWLKPPATVDSDAGEELRRLLGGCE